ncbi:MAG: Hsp70 family protein [Desulfuromonadaceae bacterium]
MARTKIDYGIDLGTTNSAIARNDFGTITIIKSAEAQQTDTTSSCVSYDKKQQNRVGHNALNSRNKAAEDAFKHYMKGERNNSPENSYIEFKRTMGDDTQYFSSNMNRGFSSEELSAEVLKKLKSFVRDEDEVRSAVITVPAMFQQPQIDATQRAAELAGFQYCELLQEPIAACIAYGLSAKRTDGYWLVFDFGGGTFDAALMKVVEGIMRVVDTSGDNHLGGKDIDYAIIDEILIPYLAEEYCLDDTLADDRGRMLCRDALKSVAEETKIALASKGSHAAYSEDVGDDENGEEMIVDRTISLSEFESAAVPIIQRSIDITKKLLERNNLSGKNLETVVLVGGPTFLQTMRRMLKEQISTNIDISQDPMTVVARGAALFASTKDIPTDLQIRDKTKIQLKLKYPETTVETEEKLGVKVERGLTTGEVPQKVFVEVARNDKGWSSGRIELEGDAEIIDLHLLPGKANGFTVALFDDKGNQFPCEPSTFTIIPEIKFPNATLTLHLCIEAVHTGKGKQCIVPIPGLEKNKSLLAKGKDTYKTQKDIRPGNKSDQIHIPLLNAEVPYSRAFPDERAGTFIITGELLPQFLPKDSDVELTVTVDESRRISCSAYFPSIDETVEHVFETITKKTADADADGLELDIEKAQQALAIIVAGTEGIDTSKSDKLESQLDETYEMLQNGRGDSTSRGRVLARLREIWKEIDKLQEESEWPNTEQELEEALEHVCIAQERSEAGNDKTAEVISQFKQQAKTIIERKDIKLAKELIDQIYSLSFMLKEGEIGFWVSMLKGFDDNFDMHEWKNRTSARRLIDDGKQMLVTSPSKSRLQDIIRELYSLLPEKEQPIAGELDDKLLRK